MTYMYCSKVDVTLLSTLIWRHFDLILIGDKVNTLYSVFLSDDPCVLHFSMHTKMLISRGISELMKDMRFWAV